MSAKPEDRTGEGWSPLVITQLKELGKETKQECWTPKRENETQEGHEGTLQAFNLRNLSRNLSYPEISSTTIESSVAAKSDMARITSLNDTSIASVKTSASNGATHLINTPSEFKTNQTQLSAPSTQLVSESFETLPQENSPSTQLVSVSFETLPQENLPSTQLVSESFETLPQENSPSTQLVSESFETLPQENSPSTQPVSESFETLPQENLPSTQLVSESFETLPQENSPSTQLVSESFETLPQENSPSTQLVSESFETLPQENLPSTQLVSESFETLPQENLPSTQLESESFETPPQENLPSTQLVSESFETLPQENSPSTQLESESFETLPQENLPLTQLVSESFETLPQENSPSTQLVSESFETLPQENSPSTQLVSESFETLTQENSPSSQLVSESFETLPQENSPSTQLVSESFETLPQENSPSTQLVSESFETPSIASTPTTTLPISCLTAKLFLIEACAGTELKPETDGMSSIVSALAVVHSISENDQTPQLDESVESKLEVQSKESPLISDSVGSNEYSQMKSTQGSTGKPFKLNALFGSRSKFKNGTPTCQFYTTFENETPHENIEDLTLNREFEIAESLTFTAALLANQSALELAEMSPTTCENSDTRQRPDSSETPEPDETTTHTKTPETQPSPGPEADGMSTIVSSPTVADSVSENNNAGNNIDSEIKSNQGSAVISSKLNAFFGVRSKFQTGETTSQFYTSLENEISSENTEDLNVTSAPPETKSNSEPIKKISKFSAFFSTRSKSKTDGAPSQQLALPENQTTSEIAMPPTSGTELDPMNTGLQTSTRESLGSLNSERTGAESLISAPEKPQPNLEANQSAIEFDGKPPSNCENSATQPQSESFETHADSAESELQLTSKFSRKSSLISALHNTLATATAFGSPSQMIAPMENQASPKFNGTQPCIGAHTANDLDEACLSDASSESKLQSDQPGSPVFTSSPIPVATTTTVGSPPEIISPVRNLASLKFNGTQPFIGAHPVNDRKPKSDGHTLFSDASCRHADLQSEQTRSPVLNSPPISPLAELESAETPTLNRYPSSEGDDTPSLLNAFMVTPPTSKLAEQPSCLEVTMVDSTTPKRDETPSFLSAPLEAQQQLTRYKKTSGAADGSGESYEWKMLTLVFLRMLAASHKFKLASNFEAAGLFDDIFVRYQIHSNHPWREAYFQLKHKKNKNIRKAAFLGFSDDFSLVKYCASYASAISSNFNQKSVENQRFIIFTNASIDGNLVDDVESDPIFATGGNAVSFKKDGIIYQELCEWVSFKEVLTELHGQTVDQSVKEVASIVKDVMKTVKYQNKAVMSYREELLKSPTFDKLKDLLKKLELISDKNTYASFLANLHVYTNQSHESELDWRIKEELAKVWIRSDTAEAALLAREIQDRVKSWWQKDSFYLTQDSWLWQGIIKSHTAALSKSTIDRLSESGAEFMGSSLKSLNDRINDIGGNGGILNYRVESRTAAGSLKVSQAFAIFGAWNINVLHVNIKALLDHEDNVLSTWETRWCRLLVVECDSRLDPKQLKRISSRILKQMNRKSEKKLLVLIATEKHELNVQLNHAESYLRFNDNFMWSDLTEKTRKDIFSINVFINGFQSALTLSELMDEHQRFVNNADLDVISQLLQGDFCCGKDLEEESEYFVTRRLKDSTDEIPFVVNSLSDVSGRVVLVVAEPGMGKSTLIKHLAKSAKAEDDNMSAWIVHIQLNDCVQYLKVMDVEHFNETEAKKFLEHCVLTPGNSLEKLLFGSLDRKLVVFIDGVDEVCPHYEQEVFTLLSFLKGMEFRQLWVASRPVCQRKLEEILRVKTFHMVAFSEQDQKEFFNKVWMDKVPSATPMKCNEFTEGLMSWLKSSLGNDNPILGIPLMTSMIAETFQGQNMFLEHDICGEFRRNERLDLLNLYKTFVGKKFDLYCVEKKKTQSRELAANKSDEENLRTRFHHNHRLAALRVLFSSIEIDSLKFKGKDKFEDDLSMYLKEVTEGREKVGIIDSVVDGNPHFVHRSFAEYFAASWLSHHYKTNREFMERITFAPAYKLVSDMFHRSLAEGHPLHVAVLNRDLKAIKSILRSQSEPYDVNGQDAGGRTPLHLAVLLSASDTHVDVTHILEFLIIDQKARLDIADHVLGWLPLQYAEWSWAWTAMHIMLAKGSNVKKITRNFKGWPKVTPFVMLNAARSASLDVVRYLVKVRGGKLNCRGYMGDTMIHRAAEGGNIEMLKYLSKKGIPLHIKDYEKNTILRYASKQSVDYLIRKGLDMNAVNKQGLTAWQDAAQHGAYANMTALKEVAFNQSSSSNFPKAQRNASLLSAAFAGNLGFVQKLVALGASVQHRDNNGHTAARLAMDEGHFKVMDWLLLQGCLVSDTTLHAACRKSEPKIVSFILSRDVAEVGVKGWDGKQPFKKQWVTKLRMERDLILNWRNKDGQTPLNEASFCGQEQIVALLLRHGADVNVADNKGWTPLMTATAGNHQEIVKLLTDRGARRDSGSQNSSLSTLLLTSLNVICSPHPQLFKMQASVIH